MAAFFADRRLRQGLSYEAYQAAWEETMQQSLAGLDKKQRRRLFYAHYNQERSTRVHHAYEVSAKLREALAKIDAPQHWMVLTEAWCADSAYALPVLVEAARLNSLIDVRIVPRDDNLDVMDRYLTGTARSIPKLVVFSEQGDELFRWGPRPEAARRLRQRAIEEGLSGAEVSKKLIDWYDQGGWEQVDDELAEALALTLLMEN